MPSRKAGKARVAKNAAARSDIKPPSGGFSCDQVSLAEGRVGVLSYPSVATLIHHLSFSGIPGYLSRRKEFGEH